MRAYLEAEDLRLDQRQRSAVDLDETTASLEESQMSAFSHVDMNPAISNLRLFPQKQRKIPP